MEFGEFSALALINGLFFCPLSYISYTPGMSRDFMLVTFYTVTNTIEIVSHTFEGVGWGQKYITGKLPFGETEDQKMYTMCKGKVKCPNKPLHQLERKGTQSLLLI